jgi:hypothetical protein
MWEFCLQQNRWIAYALVGAGLLLSLTQQDVAWVLWAAFLALLLRGTAFSVFGYRDFRQAQSGRQALAKACEGGGMAVAEFSIALIFGFGLVAEKVPHWPVYLATIGAAAWALGGFIESSEPQVSVSVQVSELPLGTGEASSGANQPAKPGMLK